MLGGCGDVALLVANVPATFGAYHRTKDVAYGDKGRQLLDVYVPRGVMDAVAKPAGARPGEKQAGAATGAPSAGRPVVVFWHGGYWSFGDKADYKFVGAVLAEHGFVTVLPDYRLYPNARFPDFVDDGARALAWVEQHIAEFGGDPHRIVLMGHSAGAHIAALVAYDDALVRKAGADPRGVVAFVGLSGPYVLEPNSERLNSIFTAPYTPSDWQPIRFVTDHSPPTLIAHGRDDQVVAVAQAEKLRDALQEKGVRVEAHFFDGKGHADTVASFSAVARGRTPALAETLAFIESVTAQSGPSHPAAP
jgi:acetyl esterase/lipase